MAIRINVDKANAYIGETFDISPDASRLCNNVFQFVSNNPMLLSPETILEDLLEAIGFDHSDIIAMRNKKIIT